MLKLTYMRETVRDSFTCRVCGTHISHEKGCIILVRLGDEVGKLWQVCLTQECVYNATRGIQKVIVNSDHSG